MKSRFQFGLVAMGFAILAVAADGPSSPYVPAKWTTFVKVEGQPLPVPQQWLQDEEARIAHNLKLPSSVPQPVPFDFDVAWWKSWLPGAPRVAVQYFNHLCKTEAGEWVFKKAQKVEGIYFARPQKEPTTDVMTDPYGPEMPWIQRIFMLTGDSARDQGWWFIQPPLYSYRFVEQPRRDVNWQERITEPYVRLFGYAQEFFVKPGQVVAAWNERTPMEVAGISKLTAQYAYTWRGLRRDRDRHYGIAGGEVLIYNLQTKEILASRRQFLIAGKNPRGEGKAMWEVAAKCEQLPAYHDSGEFKQFAFRVIAPIELKIDRKN